MYALIQFSIEKLNKFERVGMAAVSTLLFIPIFIFSDFVRGYIGFLLFYTAAGGAYGALKNRFYFSAFQTNLPQIPRRLFLTLFLKLVAYCVAGAMVWKVLAVFVDFLFGLGLSKMDE